MMASWAQSSYYAGNENPLARLGAQRVFKTITYPDWFLYPGIPATVRQQLIDDYSTREFLVSLDTSAENAPATKYNEAAQLIFDLLGTSTYGATTPQGYIRSTPSQREINDTIRHKLVPQLVKQRDTYELDSPPRNEPAQRGPDVYGGTNGDEIKVLDKDINYLARHYNIPTGYKPPSSYMSPSEREAFERNQEQIKRETLHTGQTKPAESVNKPNPDHSRMVGQCERARGACLNKCGIPGFPMKYPEYNACVAGCDANKATCVAGIP
jgi:hypothetical protein